MKTRAPASEDRLGECLDINRTVLRCLDQIDTGDECLPAVKS